MLIPRSSKPKEDTDLISLLQCENCAHILDEYIVNGISLMIV